MPTVADVIAKTRFRCDQDAGFSQVDDPDLIKAVSDLHARLHGLVAKADPGSLEATDTFTVSTADSHSLIAEATDFWLLTAVERNWGGTWMPLDRFVWEERLALVSTGLAGDYRFRYIPKAPTLATATGATGTLTDAVCQNGWDEFITEHLCALIRVRLDDDPGPHLARAKAVEQELESLAHSRDVSEPATVADVWTDDYWRPRGVVYCLRGTTLHLRTARY